MKRILFGIFAHPDDEAFTVSGTLLKEVKAGSELHLICATRGENGRNPDNHEDLSAVREKEWQHSGDLLGTRSLTQLGYPDGQLSNNVYLEIADKVKAKVTEVIDAHDELDLEFITFEPGGITGHLDHVAMSMITTYAYQGLKKDLPRQVKQLRLRYYCLCRSDASIPNLGWLYMPAGRPDKLVDEKIDVSNVFEQKLAIMDAHHTQREDAQMIRDSRGENLKYECFYYAD